MANFQLDVSRLGGAGEELTRQELSGGARWTQWKISQNEDAYFKVLGLVVFYVPSGIHQEDK